MVGTYSGVNVGLREDVAQHLELCALHNPVLTQQKTYCVLLILLLTQWLHKTNFSLPGFAAPRCAFHNMPMTQASSLAIAYTITRVIFSIPAWLPSPSVPTQYNFG